MLIIYNRYIPLRCFTAVNILGIVFARTEHGELSDRERRHEYIHTLQQREMLYVGFYIWYLAEWFYHLIRYRNTFRAYMRISLEREAYAHEHDEHYPLQRKHYSWLHHTRRNS